jgi:hypothetical protein
MGAKLYRKKPVVIEAVRYDGSTSCKYAIRQWMRTGEFHYDGGTRDYGSMLLDTLEGVMEAKPGDYIIKGVAGEFYPCKPDIFEATYESVIPQGV